MSRYPQLRSAAIPALWAVQRHYGWCSPEGIRQAAAVMGVTPAYLRVGRQLLRPLRDLARSAATGCSSATTSRAGCAAPTTCCEAFCEATGRRSPRRRPPRRELPGRRVLRQGLRVPRRLRHRADGLDRRSATTARSRPATRSPRSRRCAPGAEPLPDKEISQSPRRRRPRARHPTNAWREPTLPETQDPLPPHRRARSWRRSRATARRGGYKALERAFKELDPDELIGALRGLRACAAAAAPGSRWARRARSCPAAR